MIRVFVGGSERVRFGHVAQRGILFASAPRARHAHISARLEAMGYVTSKCRPLSAAQVKRLVGRHGSDTRAAVQQRAEMRELC